MAAEESAEAACLLRTFERRFLAARALRSFPWQSLEEKLRASSDSELLLDILQKGHQTPVIEFGATLNPESSYIGTVRHPLCVKHPPSGPYVRGFLSELIRKHEAVHADPLDELYEALAEILTTQESSQGHRSYLLPSGDAVTLSESTAIVSHGTTGLVTWDAALYLAEWVIENPAAFTGRTVLELGSGAGFTGLAICKVCRPRAYIFSDCHSRVLEQLRGNILLNGLSLEPPQPPGHSPPDSEKPTVMVAQLDWDLVTGPQLLAFQPDTVIAADVLYCPETIRSLVRVLQGLSACRAQRAPDAFVAFTIRNPETSRQFTAELGKVGIQWEAVPRHSQKLFPYDEHTETAILKLTLSAPQTYVET